MTTHDFLEYLRPGNPAVVLLNGQMGAGKTTFVNRVILELTGEELAQSPTFSIINHYKTTETYRHFDIFHADLYRIKNHNELLNTDFFEILCGRNLFFIEWPYNQVAPAVYEKVAKMGKRVINVTIEVMSDERRRITIC